MDGSRRKVFLGAAVVLGLLGVGMAPAALGARKGSTRVGGRGSSGKGSHYVGGRGSSSKRR